MKAKKTILLVDDDEDLLSLLQVKLTRDGFAVKTLLNGVNLVSKVSEELPDLILMDINMPFMNGDELCSCLRQQASTCHIPVILFSGNENIVALSSRCGANGFITKPCNPLTLAADLRSHLS